MGGCACLRSNTMHSRPISKCKIGRVCVYMVAGERARVISADDARECVVGQRLFILQHALCVLFFHVVISSSSRHRFAYVCSARVDVVVARCRMSSFFFARLFHPCLLLISRFTGTYVSPRTVQICAEGTVKQHAIIEMRACARRAERWVETICHMGECADGVSARSLLDKCENINLITKFCLIASQ